ncbi:hypothetical protein OC835_004611 [Tilletia horrida]|nr:hypothetical protein OC835_004611 [Tilletia horrida]
MHRCAPSSARCMSTMMRLNRDATFINRASSLVELTLSRDFEPIHLKTRLYNPLSKFGVLRACDSAVEAFIKSGHVPQLANIAFLRTAGLYRKTQPIAAAKATCLDIEISFQEVFEMASSLSKDHGAARFPNLVELSFRLNRDSRGDPLHSEGRDFPAGPAR